MKPPPASALVWLAAGLAAVSIGLAAVPLAARFAGDSGLQPPEAPAQAFAAGEAVSIDPILELSPFGRLTRIVAGAPAAEETTLGLTLHGVVIAQPADASRAIVSGPDAPARAYVVGEEIAAGATLAEVFGDHVVLEVGGRSEALSFPRSAEPGTPPAAREDPPEVAAAVDGDEDSGVAALRALLTGGGSEDGADPEDAEPEEAEPEGPDGEPAPDTAAPEDIGSVMETYRLRIRDDPQAVLDDLGMEATDGGYLVGGDPSEALMRAGLQPGDLVAKVNGQQVGNIEADRDVFDDATGSGHARVELVRDGRRVVLSFPLR